MALYKTPPPESTTHVDEQHFISQHFAFLEIVGGADIWKDYLQPDISSNSENDSLCLIHSFEPYSYLITASLKQ
jgi:hypothetical protein